MGMPAHRANPPGDAAQWRHHSFLSLGALPGAVPCARLHATAVLREWDMQALAHPAELVVSELVTNAVRASVSAEPVQAGLIGGIPVVELRLAGDGRRLLVEISDRAPSPPVPVGVDPDRDGGRGLLLVGSVSESWGFYYLAGEPGVAGGEPDVAGGEPAFTPEELAAGRAVPFAAAPLVVPVRPPAPGKIVWALLSPH